LKIDGKHIKQWISGHDTVTTEPILSEHFEQYLATLPWAPSRLDWSSIDHVTFDMGDSSDNSWESMVLDFAGRLPLGSHSHVMLMYNSSEPSLIAKTEDALPDIDLLYSVGPGPRYFCGVDFRGDTFVPVHQDFAEFDGFSRINFST
jgi:hypothetical protein